jgi:hypothetical protein
MDFVIRPGNVKEGGSLRARGEVEPGMEKKLSPEEIENRKTMEVVSMRELQVLKKILTDSGIMPKEVLTEPGVRRYVEGKLPAGFRYYKLEEYLKNLKV